MKRLGFSVGTVMALSVVSQGAKVIFFRLWRRLADRFDNKSVLALSGAIFVFTFLA